MKPTTEQLKLELNEALNNIVALGYTELLNNEYTINYNNRLTRALGRVKRQSSHSHHFDIELNSLFCETETLGHIRGVIYHELVHTVEGCFNHGNKFLAVGRKIQSAYGITIKRTSEPSQVANYSSALAEIKKAQNKKEYIVTCKNCGTQYRYATTRSAIVKLLLANKETVGYRCTCCGHHDEFSLEVK